MFSGCSGLTAIDVDGLNPAYSSADGVLFDKAQSLLLTYPIAAAATYSIPNGVISIGSSAFSDCTGLTNVTIPGSVTLIDTGAFAGCTGLTSVTIPDSVTSIGQWAFYHCTSLTSVTIPDSVTSIGQRSFLECSALTSVSIGNGVTSIDDYAFHNCTNLANLTIGNSVTSIRQYAFWKCSALTSVVIPNSVTRIGASAFSKCTSLTSVVVGNSVTFIEEFAFSGGTVLTSAYFEGNAPGAGLGIFTGSRFATVFYHPGKAGWGTFYEGRPTAVWVPRPAFADWALSTGLATQYPDASGEQDDPDGDGLTNGDEWFASTDPTQRASRLELELTPRPADLTASDQTPIEAGQQAVYFRSVPGRYYGVQRAGSLGGAWELQAVRIASTTQTRFALPAAGPEDFYRVLALP